MINWPCFSVRLRVYSEIVMVGFQGGSMAGLKGVGRLKQSVRRKLTTVPCFAETNKSVVLPPFNLVEKYLYPQSCLWFSFGPAPALKSIP